MCQAFGLPSSIKYEADGGPGIKTIMDLLMGSSQSLKDRDAFMRFQVFQWLIGATDGHAKNFSIFINAQGSYHLTPFYDILSAYPILGGKGMNIRSLKLAMGLTASKGKKYPIDKIYTRHFLDTAKSVRFDTARMEEIMKEFAINMPKSIKELEAELPSDFPNSISDCIFSNALRMVNKIRLSNDLQ